MMPSAVRRPTEIDVFDLFAGAGGADIALKAVCRELGITIRGHWVVNHWDAACESQVLNNEGSVLITGDTVPATPPEGGYVIIHDAVENVAVNLIAPGREEVDGCVLAPPCVHFARVRGGKPKDDQQRGTVEYSLRIIDAKRPKWILLENVPEFETWGPLDGDGHPIEERKGEHFRWFVSELRRRGYAVSWKPDFNSADYGALTTRTRLFMIARRDGKPIRWPKQTHSRDGRKPGTQPWRSARPALDLTKHGEDIWQRARPLAMSTIGRIAYRFEQKGDMWAPLAQSLRAYEREYTRLHDNLAEILQAWGCEAPKVEKKKGQRPVISFALDTPGESIASVEAHRVARQHPDTGPVPVLRMLEAATSKEDVARLLSKLDEAAVIFTTDRPVTNRSLAKDLIQPLPAATGNDRIAIAQPTFTMSGPGGGVPRDIEQPMAGFTGGGAAWLILAALICPWEGPYRGNLAHDIETVFRTFTSRGGGHLVTALVEIAETALLTPGHAERDGQNPRVMDANERPFWTMAENGAGLLTMARFLLEYYSNGRETSDTEPIPPITTRDRFALVMAILRNGLVTLHTRMLMTRELANGMSFPPDYVLAGTDSDQKKQLGNAWEVLGAMALFRAILTEDGDDALCEVAPPDTVLPPGEVSPTTGVRVHRARKPRKKTIQCTLEVPT